MGTSVKATSSETRIAKLTVRPKLRQKRPTSPPMNATGKKMAISESVVATTASTISRAPVTAASQGERPSSSMCRKMFSSTMMASSMTMPVDTDSPSIVTLLSVKPAARMAKKVAMIEVGIEIAAISAGRQFRQPRKSQTIRLASRAPSTRWCWTSPSARWMNRDWSRTTPIVTSAGRLSCSSAIRAFTRSTTATVLVPDCLRTSSDTAFWPSSRDQRARLFLAVHDLADVPHPHRPARRLRHDDGLEIRHGLDPAERAQPLLALGPGEASAGDLHALLLEGGPHLLDRQAVGLEAVGVEGELDLALALADQGDGPDVLHRLQRALDTLLGDLRQLARRPSARDHQGHDRRRVHVELLDHRRLGPRGNWETMVATFSRTSLAAPSSSRSRMKETNT